MYDRYVEEDNGQHMRTHTDDDYDYDEHMRSHPVMMMTHQVAFVLVTVTIVPDPPVCQHHQALQSGQSRKKNPRHKTRDIPLQKFQAG